MLDRTLVTNKQLDLVIFVVKDPNGHTQIMGYKDDKDIRYYKDIFEAEGWRVISIHKDSI